MNLRVHHLAHRSIGNGPGARAVVWLQGCTLKCLGCFNQKTHSAYPADEWIPEMLATAINALPIRGVTLSGGEPLQQAKAVLMFLEYLDPRLDVLLYSGFTLAEIMKSPRHRAVLLRCDAALLGRYDKNAKHPYEGKELILRTGRLQAEELMPHRTTEIIMTDRNVLMTGLPFLPGT